MQHVRPHIRLFSAIQIVAFLLLAGATGHAGTTPSEEAASVLPDRIGNFKAISPALPIDDNGNSFNGTLAGERVYQSSKGERLTVRVFRSSSDSGAYARLTNDPLTSPTNDVATGKEIANVGTLGYELPKTIVFFKGPLYVAIEGRGLPDHSETLADFARHFAETLDKGEADIPALVKHLPGWQSGGLRSLYAVSPTGLRTIVPNQPVFDVIDFAGGVEAVSANYGASRLVIVEFNTPQLATDHAARIPAKIQELRNQGQPTPTAYRRVGNYVVFVFGAPNEQAANQLIDQVKYQQVVQWLGENPFSYEQATREFTQTTLGVLVSVVKTSGLALVACLAVGGFFGALLFRFRRAQQRAVEAYTDAGAMIRLNLDEITPESDASRLLGPRK